MAKYLEIKADSLEKLDLNLASKTTRKTENSWQRKAAWHIVCMFTFQITHWTYANSVHFCPTATTSNLKGEICFSATYFPLLSLTSIIV